MTPTTVMVVLACHFSIATISLMAVQWIMQKLFFFLEGGGGGGGGAKINLYKLT